MRQGDVYDARLDPVEGSEQGGRRLVVIVSLDAINASSPTVMVSPCTTLRPHRRLYPSHVVVRAPEGGLSSDSVILAEQTRVLNKTRLLTRRGSLEPATLSLLSRALRIALDLDWASGRRAATREAYEKLLELAPKHKRAAEIRKKLAGNG